MEICGKLGAECCLFWGGRGQVACSRICESCGIAQHLVGLVLASFWGGGGGSYLYSSTKLHGNSVAQTG